MKKLTKAISKTTAIFATAPILALAPSQAELDSYKEAIYNSGAKRLGYTNKDELNDEVTDSARKRAFNRIKEEVNFGADIPELANQSVRTLVNIFNYEYSKNILPDFESSTSPEIEDYLLNLTPSELNHLNGIIKGELQKNTAI